MGAALKVPKGRVDPSLAPIEKRNTPLEKPKDAGVVATDLECIDRGLTWYLEEGIETDSDSWCFLILRCCC